MLPGISVVHPGGNSHSGILVLTDHDFGSGKDNATYDFGVAYAGRVIAVAINYASANKISTVTIGGVSATKRVADAVNDGIFGEDHNSEIWSAVVPTGATGNITCALSAGSYAAFAMAVYSVGASSATPSSTAHANDTPVFNGDPVDMTVNLSPSVNNSMVIGCASMSRLSGTTNTWSQGPTEDLDYQYISYLAATNASKSMVNSGTYTVEVKMDQLFALTSGCMATACWSP